ncbi:hypothetical protein CR513_30488, partial [Mucuna pruriens]
MILIQKVRCMLSKAKLPKHFWGETLYTAMHVINLSPTVTLNTEVPDKIWFDKNVKYDHLHAFGCKAFVHVPKDERSKLDMKTMQCIFIGLYDPVEKKLVRSCDVQFMEDQTIEDINKILLNGEQHNYVGDQQLGDGDTPDPPPVQLRRSNRERQSSTRYNFDEYVTLTDREEPECYQEAMESEDRQKGDKSTLVGYSDSDMAGDINSRKFTSGYLIKFKHIDMRYHWIRDALDVKLLELAKVHTNDNDADMMTKALPRRKFESCCEIVGLAITST